jgi:pilus assembly protein CpaE
MHSDFMAFANDEESLATLKGWAERQGFPVDTVKKGGPDLFSALLESDPPPKLAFIDFDAQEEAVQIAARLVSLCGPASKLIGLGSANDVTLYRNMIAAGMTDYLVKPLSPEALTQAMLAATQEAQDKNGKARKETKNIVFIGVRGGVGASTVATNVAWILAHEQKKKTALLDLDLQYGTSALSLDIEPGHGLRDVVSSPQRVDSLMIAGAMINESDTFSVLSAEESIEDIVHIDPYAITALLKEMKMTHQAVILDMPRHLVTTQKRVLATAHEIVLITEMSLVGIRDTLRIRTALKNLGSIGRITQVASRVGPAHPAAVDEPTFTKGAGAKIDFFMPDDPKNLAAASNAGKTLGTIAPHAPITDVVRDIAGYLLGEEKAKPEMKKKPFDVLGMLGLSAKGDV